jgi:hypothetical protein
MIQDKLMEEEDDSTDSDGGDWYIQKTDGQKHSMRTKILCAIKRNEQFEDKYEESREERDVRQRLADEKRELMDKIRNESRHNNQENL